MKDEFKGEIISEFVGLKSKMYSLITADGEEVKKAEGVNKNFVKNITHKEHINVLFNKKRDKAQDEKDSKYFAHNWNL